MHEVGAPHRLTLSPVRPGLPSLSARNKLALSSRLHLWPVDVGNVHTLHAIALKEFFEVRVRDINLQEIQRGYTWCLVKDFEGEDWLDWGIERTERVSAKDVIFHSAVLVQGNQRVYPFY